MLSLVSRCATQPQPQTVIRELDQFDIVCEALAAFWNLTNKIVHDLRADFPVDGLPKGRVPIHADGGLVRRHGADSNVTKLGRGSGKCDTKCANGHAAHIAHTQELLGGFGR